MTFLERVSLKKHFDSPATLALFGAFAVPEPFGTIILAYAAFWWWRSRKIKAAGLKAGNGPPFAAGKSQHAADGLGLFSGLQSKKMSNRGAGAIFARRRKSATGGPEQAHL